MAIGCAFRRRIQVPAMVRFVRRSLRESLEADTWSGVPVRRWRMYLPLFLSLDGRDHCVLRSREGSAQGVRVMSARRAINAFAAEFRRRTFRARTV